MKITMDIKPGIYRGMSFADYCAIPAINQSTLKEMSRSPAHYKDLLVKPRKETKAMITGRAVHTALTDGMEAFKSEYILGGPINDKTGKIYGRDSNKFQEWLAQQPADKVYLTDDEWEAVHGIIESLEDYPLIKSFLMDGTQEDNEVTMVWKDEESGLICKGRCDLLRPSWASIGDIKTNEDASHEGGDSSYVNFEYYCQGAFYIDGAKACGIDGITHFMFLFAEKNRPYGWSIRPMIQEDVALGRSINKTDLLKIAECRQSGKWPGYPETREVIDYRTGEVKKEFIPIQLPAWKRRKLTGDTGNIGL